MQESARREFSLAGLNVALQERADEQKVFEAAWVIAVAKGVETAASGTGAGTLTCRRTVTPGCDVAIQRPPVVSTSHTPHSDAWWHGVSICEQGGRNDPYFGYFSYMNGSAGGGKSWETQVAMGNRTIARYGDHAWAQACINAGYRASPSG